MSKVLIVEDSKTALAMLTDMFEDDGFEVITATDGVDGLEAAKRERPDLVVMDLNLRRVSGKEVCVALKGDDNYRNMKIVMFTDQTNIIDELDLRNAGVDLYLHKQTGPDELLDHVRELLKE